MGLLSSFSKKNRKSKHYQRNYEESKENINVEISNTLEEDVLGNKGEYYSKLREEITRLDRKKIYRIGLSSATKNDVYRKMENEGIPLEYLVALGLSEEIDIDAYQNAKLKGIEVAGEVEDVDDEIKKDILGYEEEVPELVVLTDEDGVVEEDPEEVEERLIEEENKKQIEHLISKFKKSTPVKELEEDVLDETKENVLEETNEDNEEEKENKKEVNSNNKEINNKEEKRNDKRRVYVVYDGNIPNELENYTIVNVRDVGQLTPFTSTRKDVLVVTKKVPKEMGRPFLKWFKGLSNANRKYRIVTLKESELKHSLIEDTIDLTEESLSKYFKEFTDESYTGDDVGEFRDIGMFFEEGERE